MFSLISCNNNDGEKFTIIPYGSSINKAKSILKRNNIIIKNEESDLREDRSVYRITTDGTFHSEKCEIEFIFSDGKLINGVYGNFNAYDLQNLYEKFKNELIDEFKIEPKHVYDFSYEWELPNKIQVSLMYLDSIDSLSVMYFGYELGQK
jgi:hypothetical protein